MHDVLRRCSFGLEIIRGRCEQMESRRVMTMGADINILKYLGSFVVLAVMDLLYEIRRI